MNNERKKDLIIVGGVSEHIIQFQMEDYCTQNKIRVVKQLQLK